jgi:RNA 3'-terminal phosphate cyclase
MKVREVTKHLETNVYVTKKFLDVGFGVEKEQQEEHIVVRFRQTKRRDK